MKTSLTFIFILTLASLAAPLNGQSIGIDRLAIVYAYLKNAELMASGGMTVSSDTLIKDAKKLSADTLKNECLASLERTAKAINGAPSKRKPETMAYLKNAMLRLTVDREEPHEGHVAWAQQNPGEVSAHIRAYIKTIKETLTQFK